MFLSWSVMQEGQPIQSPPSDVLKPTVESNGLTTKQPNHIPHCRHPEVLVFPLVFTMISMTMTKRACEPLYIQGRQGLPQQAPMTLPAAQLGAQHICTTLKIRTFAQMRTFAQVQTQSLKVHLGRKYTAKCIIK